MMMTQEDILIQIEKGIAHVIVNGCNPTHIMIHPDTLNELMMYYSKIGGREYYRFKKLLGLYIIEDPSIEPGHARLLDMTEVIRWMKGVNKYSVVDVSIKNSLI